MSINISTVNTQKQNCLNKLNNSKNNLYSRNFRDNNRISITGLSDKGKIVQELTNKLKSVVFNFKVKHDVINFRSIKTGERQIEIKIRQTDKINRKLLEVPF